MKLFGLLEQILGPSGVRYGVKIGHEDNFFDRICHYYANIFLIFFAMISACDEWFHIPIYCFTPNDFTLNEIEYTTWLCWVSNTYYIPWDKPIPKEPELRKMEMGIYYYQWVSVVFLSMATCNKLPRLIWKYVTHVSGVKIKRLIDTARKAQAMDTTMRKETAKHMAATLDAYCFKAGPYRAGIGAKTRERFGTFFQLNLGRHQGNYYLTWLLFVRFLYCVISFGQLLFMNAFIGNDFSMYGYEVISKFFKGEEYRGSSRFPVVTLCDIEIRRLFTFYRYTIQCVLPINLYHEKMFIFLWFFYTFLCVTSFLNLVYTILLVTLAYPRKSFVRKYLYLSKVFPLKPCDTESDEINSNCDCCTTRRKTKFEKQMFRSFVNHLSHDGVFLLKILSAQGGSTMIEDIIREMWVLFESREYETNNNFLNSCTDHIPPPDNSTPPDGDGTAVYSRVNSGNGRLGYYSKQQLLERFPKETLV